jgi:hypothetical protein
MPSVANFVDQVLGKIFSPAGKQSQAATHYLFTESDIIRYLQLNIHYTVIEIVPVPVLGKSWQISGFNRHCTRYLQII